MTFTSDLSEKIFEMAHLLMCQIISKSINIGVMQDFQAYIFGSLFSLSFYFELSTALFLSLLNKFKDLSASKQETRAVTKCDLIPHKTSILYTDEHMDGHS